jgi:tetratricopeptide (TPR) repeat protein
MTSPGLALALKSGAAFVAIAIVAAAARASPWDEVAHPNRRRCAQLVDESAKLAEARQWTGAIRSARAAVALCPSERGVLQSGGETLIAAREYAEGRQHLERARVLADRAPATREQDVTLAYFLGVARALTADLDGAVDEHRRVEAMGGLPSPNQYLVHDKLGEELMAAGRLGEAIEEYHRAVSLAPPTKPIVRVALAVALDRDEQIDRARAELAAVLALDPELRCLASDEQVFVPREDRYYYRALAQYERGATAEARLDLRTFVAELPTGPYAAHARQRLADAEQHVDARELEVAGVDRQTAARLLGPVVSALESCLPAQRVMRVRLLVSGGRIATDPQHPAAECLDHVLSQVDTRVLSSTRGATIAVPLAGRRAAASLP